MRHAVWDDELLKPVSFHCVCKGYGTAQFEFEQKLHVVMHVHVVRATLIVFSSASTCKTSCLKNTRGYILCISMRVPDVPSCECISEYSKRMQHDSTCARELSL